MVLLEKTPGKTDLFRRERYLMFESFGKSKGKLLMRGKICLWELFFWSSAWIFWFASDAEISLPVSKLKTITRRSESSSLCQSLMTAENTPGRVISSAEYLATPGIWFGALFTSASTSLDSWFISSNSNMSNAVSRSLCGWLICFMWTPMLTACWWCMCALWKQIIGLHPKYNFRELCRHERKRARFSFEKVILIYLPVSRNTYEGAKYPAARCTSSWVHGCCYHHWHCSLCLSRSRIDLC